MSKEDLFSLLFGRCQNDEPSATKKRRNAYAWARVSTVEQEERGLSIPEQLREMRRYSVQNEIDILAEFSEAASAFRHQERRTEFLRMLELVRTKREVSMILVHDYSRFFRDADAAKSLRRELLKIGVRVVSVTEPEIDPETVSGLFMEAFFDASAEGYSRQVAFHTHKGCRANIKTRDPETGWCFKNGGQPLFGYRAERLVRGEIKRGRPNIKLIWIPDETIIAGRPIHEWARHCLVELAGDGASLDELRDFCHSTGIPGRRQKYWGISTWHALLQPNVLLQYAGYAVWNVHTKQGRVRPASDWIICERAHEPLISEAEVEKIVEARRSQSGKKRFELGTSRTRSSPYLLSGGPFRCARCGASMVGFRNQTHSYYVCGSQPYRKGMGCGPGVYVPQAEVEAEVLHGLSKLLGVCADPKGFTRQVNADLRELWQASTGFRTDSAARLAAIDKKVERIRVAVEDGLNDAAWANARLEELLAERAAVISSGSKRTSPPQIDVQVVLEYRR